jgi:hypothetical protein
VTTTVTDGRPDTATIERELEAARAAHRLRRVQLVVDALELRVRERRAANESPHPALLQAVREFRAELSSLRQRAGATRHER